MSAEQFTPEQVEQELVGQPQPELQLVPEQAEQVVRDDTEKVKEFLEKTRAYDNVPQTPEEADEKATHIRGINEALQKRVSEGKVHVEEGAANVLQRTAEEGPNLWRLDKEGRAYYRSITKAEDVESLGEDVLAGYDTEEITPEAFAAMQKDAESRLAIDYKLYKREQQTKRDAEPKETAAEKTPEQPEAQKTTRKRVATREQGPADGSKAAEIISVEPKNIETASKPVVTTRTRGGARREQGAVESTGNTDVQTQTEPEIPTVTMPEMSDLGIKIDARGMGHRNGGKFISKNQLEQIEDRADLIQSDMQGSREEYEAEQAAIRAETDAAVAKEMNKISLREAGRSKMAQEQNPVIAAAVKEAAIAKVKADGRDVSHLEKQPEKPSGVPDAVWEQLSATQQAEFNDVWHNQLDDDSRAKAVADWEAANSKHNRPDDFPEEVWATLGEDEKERALSQWEVVSKEDWQHVVDGWEGKSPEEVRALFAEAEKMQETQTAEPVTDISEKGIKARLKRIFQKGKHKATAAYTTVGNKLINPFNEDLSAEEMKKRANKMTFVVGALAVSKAYLIISGLHHGGGDGTATHVAHQKVVEGTTLQLRQPELPKIHAGDHPYDVLQNAGVPESEIMPRLDDAAKESGLPFAWHGSGDHQWLEVDGKSDTKAVMRALAPYIKR